MGTEGKKKRKAAGADGGEGQEKEKEGKPKKVKVKKEKKQADGDVPQPANSQASKQQSKDKSKKKKSKKEKFLERSKKRRQDGGAPATPASQHQPPKKPAAATPDQAATKAKSTSWADASFSEGELTPSPAKPAAQTGGGEGTQGKKKKKRWRNQITVFVNLLPYTANPGTIRKHFAECGVESVRMVNDPNKHTRKFKGMAFVVLQDAQGLAKALALDGSKMGDKAIHVSVPEDADVQQEKKRKRIEEVEKTQAEAGKTGQSTEEAEALVDACVKEGVLSDGDADERVVEFLCFFTAGVARKALEEFGKSVKGKDVPRRPAFLMGVLKRYSREIADGDLGGVVVTS